MTWYALAMFISDKSDVEKLNFAPRNHCFTMARVEWKNVVLNPGERDDWPLVDLSDLELTRCLLDLFGTLSLIETFELFSACEEFPQLSNALDRKQYMTGLNKQWSERTDELFQSLTNVPKEFLSWAHQKQLGQRELQPLVSLQDLHAIAPLLAQFPEQNLSRNEGKQALDLIIDLYLLKTTMDSMAPPTNGKWLEHLNKLRHPLTQSMETPSATNGWPKYVQVVNFRQGDRVLKKMQITYLDQDDLSQKLQRLSKTEPTL